MSYYTCHRMHKGCQQRVHFTWKGTDITGKEIFGLTYRKWLENTHKRPENKDWSRKFKKRIPAILLGFLVEMLYLFLYNTLKFVFISIIRDQILQEK